MTSLSVRNIAVSLGGNPILRGVDLEVQSGELVVLVGPSGCGKSTLLRAVAGLESPSAGTLHLGERDVTHLPPRDRDIAMVFQSYALYPHLTVRDNLAFGLRLRGTDAALVKERIAEVSRMLGLAAYLDRFPRQLSGGQRQRVAMGRAIARRPALFLFDEPLSNLDAALRSEVRVEIKRLHAQLGTTMLYVTHDQVEAMTLADRIVVLNKGVIEQAGPPLEVYGRPVSRFVASFLGSPAMNFVPARIEGGRIVAEAMHLDREIDSPDRDILVGIRPHDVRRARVRGAFTLQVDVVEAMGFETYAHGQVGGTPFVARLEGDLSDTVHRGDELALEVDPAFVHLFDHETERAIDPGEA